MTKHGTGSSSYCASLYCISQILHFFDKWKVCGNPASSRSIGAMFPTAFARLVSVTFWYSCNISNFLLLLYLLWWFVISDFDLSSYHSNCFGAPEPNPRKMAKLIDKCVCSDWSTDHYCPILSPPALWDTTVLFQYWNYAN